MSAPANPPIQLYYACTGWTVDADNNLFPGAILGFALPVSTPTAHAVVQGQSVADSLWYDLYSGAAGANTLLTNTYLLLTAHQPYEANFGLIARNSDGDSSRTTFVPLIPTGEAIPTACSQVSEAKLLAISAVTGTTATLAWTNKSTPTHASHWRVTIEAFGVRVVDDFTTWDVQTYNFTGLTAGTIYTAKVSGYFKIGGAVFRSAPASIDFLTTPDGAVATIEGPDEVDLGTSDPTAATWTCHGNVIAWNLLGDIPTGLAVAPRAGITGNQLVDLTGSTSQTGIFDTRLQATISALGSGSLSTATKDVRFTVAGADTLEWFDGDPDHIAIQIDERQRTVRSNNFDVTAGLTLYRGDTQRIHFIMRDLARVSDPDLSALALTIRLPGQTDGAALLEYRQDGTVTEVIGTHTLPYFDVDAEGEFLDYCFDRLREAYGSSATQLEAEAEVTWTNTGKKARTAQVFKVILIDDRNV